ncbi:MAG: hypothetical protein HZA03_02075 [Nitrospinae bacterium]|nr:hypothetical protein [Nitrospinota bacterium]
MNSNKDGNYLIDRHKHIQFEAWMMNETLLLLTDSSFGKKRSGSDRERVEWQATLDSYIAHCRCLVEFFTMDKRHFENDVWLGKFDLNWKIETRFGDFYTNSSQRLVHLTESRFEGNIDWLKKYSKITPVLNKHLIEFCDKVCATYNNEEAKRLYEDLKKELTTYSEKANSQLHNFNGVVTSTGKADTSSYIRKL